MRAAEKTVNFVKQWINGTYTQRSYQNYYIVKTPNAQFLMKQTESRECLAVRDNSGHIYMFDNDLYVYNNRTSTYAISETEAMSNPLLCLLQEDYDFKHTRIDPASIRRMSQGDQFISSMSKWKTLDRVEVKNISLDTPIYLSLIEAGDLRLYISPDLVPDSRIPVRTPLIAWTQHIHEKEYKFLHKWVHYAMTSLYTNKINSVADIKNIYLAMAGDRAEQSWTGMDGWVGIPTYFSTIEEITGQPFNAVRATRPNPYAYGLVNPSVNLQLLFRRFETIDENVDTIRGILNFRDSFDSSNWKDALALGRLPEITKNIIDFFEADDAWLRDNYEIARAGALEARVRSKLPMAAGIDLLYVNEEPNSSPLSEYVLYLKSPGSGFPDKFVKLIPTPCLANKVKDICNASN